MASLIEAGFDAFIDLTEAGELPPYDIYLPGSVSYVRKPIPDHGVPRAREHMAEIQAELDAALARGRRVYVHCRAGIGRTGTVVACHLIEQGLAPDAALIRLNELWQDNERSATWPDVPETDEQRDYILAWSSAVDPTQSPDVLDAARTLRERFQGALVGLAVGDALAAHTQFRKPGSFARGRRPARGRAIRPAAGRLDRRYRDGAAAGRKPARAGRIRCARPGATFRPLAAGGFGSATGQCVGISANVARALATAQYKRQPFAGSHDPEQLDKDPLSRVAPTVMYFFADAPSGRGQGRRVGPHHGAGAAGPRLRASAAPAWSTWPCQAVTRPQVLRPPRELWDRAEAPARKCCRSTTASYARRNPPEITGGGGILQALEAALWAFSRTRDLSRGCTARRESGPGLGCSGGSVRPDRRRAIMV